MSCLPGNDPRIVYDGRAARGRRRRPTSLQETHVARAKRTDRAAARRRHRAQQVVEPDELDTDDGVATADDRRARAAVAASRPRGAPADAGSERPQGGIGYAFRAAFRQAHIRDDLAHIGENLRQRSLWLTCLVSVAVAVAYVAFQGREVVSGLLFQYFVYPPPVGAIFIAGFFARRASYLAGAIAGIVSGVAFCVVVAAAAGSFGTDLLPSPDASPSPSVVASATGPAPSASVDASASAPPASGASAAPSAQSSPLPSPTPSGSGTVQPGDFDTASAITYALTVSPISGIVFGAAAAWYRRFLNLANPNRGQRRPPPKGKARR
jgi:hypothetical protein